MKTRPSAFALFEILVVTAIAAVLVVLGFSISGRVREHSASVQCMSHLRQLGQAMYLFAQDHNGTLPPILETNLPGPVFGKNVPSWGPTWAEYLVKIYLNGDKTMLLCPARPATWGNPAGYYPDYAYNASFCPLDAATGLYVGMKLSVIRNPSHKILLADAGRLSGEVMVGGYYSMQTADRLFPRHAGSTVNVLYLDQHIESHHYIQTGKLPPPGDPLGRHSFDPEAL